MATNRLADIKTNIDCLPTYDGTSKKHLNTFIKQIDRLMEFLNILNPPLTDFEKFTVINGIISKLKGKALESLDNTDTTSWINIKRTLQGQHLIFKTYATVFNEIIYTSRKDPYELFEIINEKAKDFNNLIFQQYPTDDHIVTVFEKIIIQNFINKVSEPSSSNLANRQPASLAELGNLLQNDYQFLKYKQPKTLYIPNNSNNNNNKNYGKKMPNVSQQQQSSAPNFPSGPVQFNYNTPRRNFAPRQNVINNQRKQKPTPMSTQTKFTMGQNNNYFTNQNRQFGQQKPNFTFEEIQHQEILSESNDEDNTDTVEQNPFLGIGNPNELQGN